MSRRENTLLNHSDPCLIMKFYKHRNKAGCVSISHPTHRITTWLDCGNENIGDDQNDFLSDDAHRNDFVNLNASRSGIGYAIGSECDFGSDCENGFQNDLNEEN